MKTYAVTCNKECRNELRKIGEITYECDLLDDFLFLKTNKSLDEIKQIDGVVEAIDGVVEAREQYTYRLIWRRWK